MGKRLVVVAGPDEGRMFPLQGDSVLLGRSRATDTHLIDPHVSRVHCEVKPVGDDYVLTDLESPAGSFINGVRVSQQVLKAGDLIRIGATHLQVMEDVSAAAIDAPAAGGSMASAPTAELPATSVPTAAPRVAKNKRGAKPARPTDWAPALVGKTFSHYSLGSILARARSGFVFHARDTKRNLPVVVKVLNPAFSSDAKSVQRFVKAMKVEGPLRHPHLVRVYGAGKSEGYCWVAKEFVQGDSLNAVIGRIEIAGPLEWRRVVRMAFYIASALSYAHGKNLIHKNVTPQNILLGADVKQTKLADLMLATALEEDPTEPISAAGVPSEGLAYMPPERTDGPGAPVDARADVYSLGATIHAMLAGRPPFQSASVQDLVQKIRLEAPPTFQSLNVRAPEGLETIVRRMLAKRPQDRFATMRDVMKDLQKLVTTSLAGK